MVFHPRTFDFEEDFTKIERIIYRHARFEDVARIAVYLFADCSKEWKVAASKSWASIKRMEKLRPFKKLKYQSLIKTVPGWSRHHFNELMSTPKADWPIFIDWASIYNAMVQDAVLEAGGKTGYDEWGAFGFINEKGVKHMGDSRGMFGFYGDQYSLDFDLRAGEDDVPWTKFKEGIDYIIWSIKREFDDFL